MFHPERSRLSPEQINSFYWEYVSSGGQLNEKTVNESLLFLNNGRMLNSGLEKQKICCRQCERYAGLAGFTLRSEQTQLYAYLRSQMPSPKEEYPDGVYPWRLGDQPLLAEVCLLTGDGESYQRLERHFPHIFNNHSTDKDPSRPGA